MAPISEEEKLRRRQAVQSVLGTNAMEGVFLDTPALKLMEQFENGEIEIEQFSASIDLHVQQMAMPLKSDSSSLEHVAVDAA